MSTPTWTLIIPKGFIYLGDTGDAYVIAGTGQPPVAEVSPPPPGDPAAPTPPPPPADLPPEDDSPFAWPSQPPVGTIDSIETRGLWVGTDPITGSSFLAALPEEANPQPNLYMSAGFLPSGRRLWAPFHAKPSLIRRLLATGHV